MKNERPQQSELQRAITEYTDKIAKEPYGHPIDHSISGFEEGVRWARSKLEDIEADETKHYGNLESFLDIFRGMFY